YAQECLDAADERRALAHRHAEYYLALAEQGEQGITSGNQAEWLDRLEADHANLLSALRSCIDAGEADQAVRLASVLWRFWWRRGHLTEGRLRTAEVLAMPAVQETTSLRASALLSAGLLALWQADYETARQLLGDSLEAARRAGDQRTFAYALVFQGR